MFVTNKITFLQKRFFRLGFLDFPLLLIIKRTYNVESTAPPAHMSQFPPTPTTS